MSNYDKLLLVLSKWPNTPKTKIFNYGQHLKQFLKNKNINDTVFPGGSMMEDSEKLNSLLRLTNNIYSTKYPNYKEVGASGIKVKNLEMTLSNEFIEYFQKNVRWF